MGLAMVVTLVAAVYLGIRANFDPTIGPARLLYAFEAVIIGGLGSFWGTLAGGIIIGIAQTIGAHVNPEWQILAGHLAFLAVLIARPRGLFPRVDGLSAMEAQHRIAAYRSVGRHTGVALPAARRHRAARVALIALPPLRAAAWCRT